jgi:hypothetical protein
MARKQITDDETNAPFAPLLALCDAIAVEPESGKISILGCLGSIAAGAFPLTYPRLVVYAEVTDGRGLLRLHVRITDIAANVLFESEAVELDFSDPHLVHGVYFDLHGVVFPALGEYRVRLFSGSA